MERATVQMTIIRTVKFQRGRVSIWTCCEPGIIALQFFRGKREQGSLFLCQDDAEAIQKAMEATFAESPAPPCEPSLPEQSLDVHLAARKITDLVQQLEILMPCYTESLEEERRLELKRRIAALGGIGVL